ncbi:MAG: hypothetical protein EOO45_21330 [Flavobacterium sp.]|nr:MAG: hypothetical protein EOO45_21330 [Flavobacterium sp.]
MEKSTYRIALIGGGPASLFMFKRLVESKIENLEVAIYERKAQLGAGMPYSNDGALMEHITNVSANEIPDIVSTVAEWVNTAPSLTLAPYNIITGTLNEYKVLPRLLFGYYLEDQFRQLLQIAHKNGIAVNLHLQTDVVDIIDSAGENATWVKTALGSLNKYNKVVLCTGHKWPQSNQEKNAGYFDSPYPPQKIAKKMNHPVALRGSSLTAVDAIRTLARANGHFEEGHNKELKYIISEDSQDFTMVMHTRNGLLPAVRFHLDDTHLNNDSLLSEEDIAAHRNENDGFLSLDYIFEKDFKEIIRAKDPEFYERIRHLNIEGFVAEMMELRERLDPFVLLRAEYNEAEKSIKRHESVFWKEMLAVLSFAMNYPAKYFSAEDMMRLKGTLMPLISIVIAFLPQTSCRELLALHSAGKLDIVPVGEDSEVENLSAGGINYHYTDDEGKKHSDYYKVFVDCIGQPALQYEDFPFAGLVEGKVVSPARLRFRDEAKGAKALEGGNSNVQQYESGYYLRVPGIGINDDFQVLNQFGAFSERVYIMAVPYIGGYNPDYSGLDFAEAASQRIIDSIERELVVS